MWVLGLSLYFHWHLLYHGHFSYNKGWNQMLKYNLAFFFAETNFWRPNVNILSRCLKDYIRHLNNFSVFIWTRRRWWPQTVKTSRCQNLNYALFLIINLYYTEDKTFWFFKSWISIKISFCSIIRHHLKKKKKQNLKLSTTDLPKIGPTNISMCMRKEFMSPPSSLRWTVGSHWFLRERVLLSSVE